MIFLHQWSQYIFYLISFKKSFVKKKIIKIRELLDQAGILIISSS